MTEQLSTSWTSFYRIVFPTAMFGMLAGFDAMIWSDSGVTLVAKCFLTLLLVVACAFALWFLRTLSEVWLNGTQLVIATGRVVERIRLVDVEQVTDTRFGDPRLIRLRLRPGVASREQLWFYSAIRLQLIPSTEHEITRRLRAAIAAAHEATE